VARTQIKRKAIIRVFAVMIKGAKAGLVVDKGAKNTTENSLMTRILAYSAIKINANGPALYSVLNPDTSSDSPSAKSKGVRFVSAKVVVNQVIVKGITIIIGKDSW